MKYDIRLTITHVYNQPAANGRHLVRVVPRTIAGRQRLVSHRIDVSPEPDGHDTLVDFFANEATSIAHTDPHAQMTLQLACRVEMTEPDPWQDISCDPARLRKEWDGYSDLGARSPLHFRGPAPRLSPDGAIAEFANDVSDPNSSVCANVIAVGRALHAAMTFDSTATTVDTDASEAFQNRRGVCQDFTHIMILALQSLGIPAGYVSGYLRTLPPEGGVKLAGADAMHAWVRAWCGSLQGWVEYDPTNATLVGSDHIVVGYGRDYSDVSPVKGHLRLSGGQRNAQSVDVVVVD